MGRVEVEAQGRTRDAAWQRGVTRLGELSSQLAQVHAAMVEETEALLTTDGWVGDGGIRSPQHFLQVFGWLSPAHANQLVTVATRAAELPETIGLMEQGRLSLDQATVVAQHVPATHSRGAAELAEMMTVSQLRRTLSKYCFQDIGTPTEEAPLPDRPELTITSHGRRFRLHLETTPEHGAVVEQAIREAKDALFSAGNPHATLADGLIEVATRSLNAATTSGRTDHYRILIHLDVNGDGWLTKKGALPQALLKKMTCDGKIIPVWEKDGNPVAVGRAQRIVPERTRRLIEDRDRGCRYPGCPVTAFLENHHLTHWADGGNTDPDNLLSLCPFHHSEHHQGRFTIRGTPTTPDGLIFTTSRGYVIAPLKPWPPPVPPSPTPANTDILRGDWCDNQWLQIPPNEKPSRPPCGSHVPPDTAALEGPTQSKDPPSSDAA